MEITLKALRVNNLTQKQAPERVGISEDKCVNWGKAKTFPDVPKIKRIENEFKISYNGIFFCRTLRFNRKKNKEFIRCPPSIERSIEMEKEKTTIENPTVVEMIEYLERFRVDFKVANIEVRLSGPDYFPHAGFLIQLGEGFDNKFS